MTESLRWKVLNNAVECVEGLADFLKSVRDENRLIRSPQRIVQVAHDSRNLPRDVLDGLEEFAEGLSDDLRPHFEEARALAQGRDGLLQDLKTVAKLREFVGHLDDLRMARGEKL